MTPAAGTITYEESRQPTGSHHARHWWAGKAASGKPDWAMRWLALGRLDYEMAGKDLIDSVKLSGDICRALWRHASRKLFNYGALSRREGPERSPSPGGKWLTIDEWLRLVPAGSIAVALHVSASAEGRAKKRLYFDVITTSC